MFQIKSVISWASEPPHLTFCFQRFCFPETYPPPSGALLLDFFGDVLHQIAGLAVEDFAELDDGVNGHASIIHEAVYRLGVDLVDFAKVYLLQALLVHKIEEFGIRNRHSLSSFVP